MRRAQTAPAAVDRDNTIIRNGIEHDVRNVPIGTCYRENLLTLQRQLLTAAFTRPRVGIAAGGGKVGVPERGRPQFNTPGTPLKHIISLYGPRLSDRPRPALHAPRPINAMAGAPGCIPGQGRNCTVAGEHPQLAQRIRRMASETV